MAAPEGQIRVSLPGGGGYPIRIGFGNLSGLGSVMREGGIQGEIFLVSDRAVWDLHGGALRQALADGGYALLDTFVTEPGEASKSLETWGAALDRLVAQEDGTARFSVFGVHVWNLPQESSRI